MTPANSTAPASSAGLETVFRWVLKKSIDGAAEYGLNWFGFIGGISLMADEDAVWAAFIKHPEVAVESLETIVLLTMSVASASSSDAPPPSIPATLLATMLLVTWTAFHGVRVWKSGCAECPEMLGRLVCWLPLGKLSTSVPLMCCNLKPPPLPLSAELPRIR